MRNKKSLFTMIIALLITLLALLMLDGDEESTKVPEPETTLVEETRKTTERIYEPSSGSNEERAPEDGWPQYEVPSILAFPKPDYWGCEHPSVVRRDGYYYIQWCDGEAGPCDSFKYLSGGSPSFIDEEKIDPVTYICVRGQKEIFGLGEREGKPYDTIEHFRKSYGNAIFAGKRGRDWHAVYNFDEYEAHAYVADIMLVGGEPVYVASDSKYYHVYWKGEVSPPYDEVALNGDSGTTYNDDGERVFAEPVAPIFTAYVDGEEHFLHWRAWLAKDAE